MAKTTGSTTLINRLQEFIEEDNGSLSATRLAFLLWVVGVLIVWIVESVRLNSIQGVTGDVSAIIGILMTGKVMQKFAEKPASDQNSADDSGKPAGPVQQ